ncbi:MAG: polysaccharide deacetylase family protein [Chloroflexi bacterium]|nr:polysaccharide deacetylase family protein [Chloroflexota bacterium]
MLLLALVGLLIGGPGAAADETLEEVVRGPTDSALVALTFDAGGVAGPAGQVLATLRERGIRATFFLSGHWLEDYPELAAQVGDDGHELANHTYSHPDLRYVSNDRLAWELVHTDELIEALAGRKPVSYFRPPFGARDPRVLGLAAELGYRSVMWALDSADWRTEATPSGVAARVLSHARAGDVVVMHVASEATAAALPDILDGLEARGLQVVTVSELLAGAPISATPTPTSAASADER